MEKILIIGDPLTSLKLHSDSSLALAEAAIKLGKKVFWCEPQDVCYFNYQILLNHTLEISFASTDKLEIKSEEENNLPFDNFKLCFVRKDPPFDEEYKNLCWILSTQNKVQIINSPELLLSYHEKSLQWRAYAEGFISKAQLIPTCLTHSVAVLEEFCSQFSPDNKFISKPWLGHGGEGVMLHENKKDVSNFFLDRLTKPNSEKICLIQPYLPEIKTEGDRRVFVVNGEIIFDFVRLPPSSHVASNLAQGGTAHLRPMSPKQIDICFALSKFLKEKGILFAGIDLIGEYVGEINITSPTGIRTFELLSGKKVADKIFKLLYEVF